MSIPLIDFRGKVTPETDASQVPAFLTCPRTVAAIVATAAAQEITPETVIRQVMATWADARIKTADALIDVLMGRARQEELSPRDVPLEKEIEDKFCLALEAAGIPHERQVKTESGIADVVLQDMVIEVKRVVGSPSELAKAHGQALMYARQLGKAHCAVLAHRVTTKARDKSIRLICGADSINAFLAEVSHE